MKMQQKVENVWAAEARAAADTSQAMLKKCVGRTRPFFPSSRIAAPHTNHSKNRKIPSASPELDYRGLTEAS